MTSVEDYLGIIAGAIRPLPASVLPLTEAEGGVLAEDVTAAVSLPPFDNSAMDGYAVRASDTASASEASPAVLPVTAEIAAGDTGSYQLAPGTAMKIMTGARLPLGADSVIQVEWTDGGSSQVAISRPVSAGTAVRYAGGDAREGEVLIPAGLRLRPTHVAVTASAGRPSVAVRPRPRVVILSTGDELTEPGTPLMPGQIWDSNSYMLASLAREAGAGSVRRTRVRDDVEGVLPAIKSLLEHADLIITTGGVSMGGEHDVVKAALESLGTVGFRKVAMQPGMPQGFGMIESVPVFTLPGNPVSAYVSFQLFVRRALGFLQGVDDLELPVVSAELAADVRSPAGRRSYLRGTFDGTTAEAFTGQGSHQIAALGRADSLIIVPESETQLSAGETVDVIVLP
ncbi:MAG: molybdopterin molybdotransferase MoeA [Streptosporangiales bacterium]|nr:molybdopterin molybdotransferase MoeA [Streptosporangiales bacterium]